jgi:hypothetical protein
MTATPSRSRDAGWGIGAWLLLHIVMIALAFAWVAFYSYLIEPGHESAFYEAYAGRSSPIVSLVAGGPVFYLVAGWLTRRRGSGAAAWIAAALYLLTDLAIFLLSGQLLGPIGLIFLVGGIVKLAGTAFGVGRAKR